MGVYRPGSVTALVIIFIILGIVGIISVIVTEAIINSTYQTMVFTEVIGSLAAFYASSNIPYLYPVDMKLFSFAFMLASTISFATNMQTLSIVMYLVIAFGITISVLCFIASCGLFFMKKWGYYLALIIGILSLPSVIGILLVIYLLVSDVKYEFE